MQYKIEKDEQGYWIVEIHEDDENVTYGPFKTEQEAHDYINSGPY